MLFWLTVARVTSSVCTRALPLGYKRMMRSMEKSLTCRRCGRHVGLDWRTRGSFALHPECAELHDMAAERRELQTWAESHTPEGHARLQRAEAQLAAAMRRRV